VRGGAAGIAGRSRADGGAGGFRPAGTDGFACAAWLRQAAGFAGPVILMLTFPHLKRKSECADIGVNATLLKPFGSRELMQALAKLRRPALAQRPRPPAARSRQFLR